MKNNIFSTFALMCALSSPAIAQQFGKLTDAEFRSPEHDGMSAWSIANPTVINTTLAEGFSAPLTVEFKFEFSPNGDFSNNAYVLPTSTDGLGVKCTGQILESYYREGSQFAECTVNGLWIDTIDEQKTLTFAFLSPGGQASNLPNLTWTISPFVPPVEPVKVETISVREPYPKGATGRVRLQLNRPAEVDTFVTVGFSPVSCIVPNVSRLNDPRNDPSDPVYLFDRVFIKKDDLFGNTIITTADKCRSTSFVIDTWVGEDTSSFDPSIYTGREVDFRQEN